MSLSLYVLSNRFNGFLRCCTSLNLARLRSLRRSSRRDPNHGSTTHGRSAACSPSEANVLGRSLEPLEDPADVGIPRVPLRRERARVRAEHVPPRRVVGEPPDARHELALVCRAWRATPPPPPEGSPSGSSETRTPGWRTSPIWSSSDATIGSPIAMYSKSFVGEPKNGEPSSFGTCGERTRSDAARYAGASACGTRPASVWNGPFLPAEHLLHLGHAEPVADEEEVQPPLRKPAPAPRQHEAADRTREHVRAVPAAEGADERRDERVVGDSVPARAARERVAASKRAGSKSSVSTQFGYIDDPPLLDAALEQLVAKHVRDGHDDVRVPQQHLLGLLGEPLVPQRPAPVPRDPDLRAVVLDDERHAERPREPYADVAVDRETLVDERGRLPSARARRRAGTNSVRRSGSS